MQNRGVEITAAVRVNNIGGISETVVNIPSGVTVLEGRNATNRTSFLQAIMCAIGSDAVTLKGDAKEGSVEMQLGDETYQRTLRRKNGEIITGGDSYLDDPSVAELFSFLLESNEARRAVVRGDNLRELIMRPIDTNEIRAKIDRLERERDDIDQSLEGIDSLKSDLPSLEQRRTELEAEIEAKQEELADKEADIETMDSDVEETREEKQELESRLEELRELRSELNRIRSDIELQEESIEALRKDRSELQAEREQIPDAPMSDYEQVKQDLSRLRGRKQSLEAEMNDLQNTIQFNEQMLEGKAVISTTLTTEDTSRDAVTDQLLGDEQVACWACGSEVDRDRMADTLDRLRSVRADRLDDIREIEAELAELQEKKQEREQQQRRRETIERNLTDIMAELDRRKERLDEIRAQRTRLNDDIETTEREVKALEAESFSDILELHKQANQLEFELGQLESDLDDVVDRIATIEDQIAEESDIERRREKVMEALEKQRTRIDRIERQAVEAFNEHMAEIIDFLEYDNLERIWIERSQTRVREGRQKVEKTVFEIHVVRTTDSGVTYEDTIDHLSESEREVTGLVFALAGYLVHDVYETVPFMLLDSLEAIDARRIAKLVSYFSEYASYLVVALLHEDAQALPDEYPRVTEI